MASKIDRIYAKSPIFLQNLACSYYGWKKSRQRYNHFFDSQLESLKESEWWNRDQIVEHQNANIAKIVSSAYKDTVFYRNWFDQHDVKPEDIKTVDDLKSLPVLTKDQVRANQLNMVSQKYQENSLIKEKTSGTTGTPLTIYFTEEGLAKQWAVWWRHKSRFGLTRKSRHLSFGGKAAVPQGQTKPPYWRTDYFGNRVYLSVYHISSNTIKDIVDYLNRNRFDFYTGAASGMYTLSSAIEESGLELTSQPKWIVGGADVLLPSFKKSFEKNFGAQVTEQYGMSEFAGNMSRCEKGNFHVDFEICHVEHLPIQGTDYSRLILTGWGNDAMPFIRYEVGDLAKPITGQCECGRHSDCFESVDGRLEDYVITPDGRKLMGMNQVLQYAEHAKEIQIYQPQVDEVIFRVVAGDGFGDDDRSVLESEFKKRAGCDISIGFEIVESLERAASGKVRAVISKPANDLRDQNQATET